MAEGMSQTVPPPQREEGQGMTVGLTKVLWGKGRRGGPGRGERDSR